MELAPQIERSTNELMNYGALGALAVLFIIGAVFIVRWAFKKIDEAQTRQDALHTFYGEKLEAKEKNHSLEIQKMHEEYTDRMEAIGREFKEALENNTKAMNDMRTELRILAEQRGWDGRTERRQVAT